jgi:hypothetical protein
VPLQFKRIAVSVWRSLDKVACEDEAHGKAGQQVKEQECPEQKLLPKGKPLDSP